MSFDGHLAQNAYNKLYQFRNYMARRKSLDYQPIQSGTVKSFRVLTAVDSSSLKEQMRKEKKQLKLSGKIDILKNFVGLNLVVNKSGTLFRFLNFFSNVFLQIRSKPSNFYFIFFC